MPTNSEIALVLLARTSQDGGFDSSLFYIIIALVGIFAGLLFLAFFKTRIFPLFRLWYISIVHGRFSFEFQEFFKDNNLRNPHNNCIKDEITLHFLLFYKQVPHATHVGTAVKIEFGNVPFLINYKSLAKRKGTPDCINIAWFGKSRVKVVGYYETVNSAKMRSLYYFIDDRFILGEFVFPELAKSKPEKIRGPIATKYLGGQMPAGDIFYITDSAGDMLNYENNGFSINIRYLCKADPTANQVLTGLFETTGENRPGYLRTMKDEELINRF
jgi:hypothetical protein